MSGGTDEPADGPAVAVVQARMSSTRLPGKVLRDVAGEPMLARVLGRLGAARRIDRVVVATSTDPSDDELAAWCDARGVTCRRGSLHDVLDRYRSAAEAEGADVVVRVTSDCPLLDGGVTDAVIAALRASGADYASNTLSPRSFPRGLDVEAFTAAALDAAWREDDDARGWREHVTPFLYNNPGRFRLERVTDGEDRSAHRWTVDTPEDLELARRVWSHFEADPNTAGGRFTWRDVLAVVEARPEWAALNRHVEQKKVG